MIGLTNTAVPPLDLWLGLALAVVLFAYLIVALLRPERF